MLCTYIRCIYRYFVFQCIVKETLGQAGMLCSLALWMSKCLRQPITRWACLRQPITRWAGTPAGWHHCSQETIYSIKSVSLKMNDIADWNSRLKWTPPPSCVLPFLWHVNHMVHTVLLGWHKIYDSLITLHPSFRFSPYINKKRYFFFLIYVYEYLLCMNIYYYI